MRNSTVDETDIRILQALAANGRKPLAELGREIGLSQPTMSERVKRLEERGVICGYRVRIDPEALGLGLSAMVRLATNHSEVHACLEKLRAMPSVVE